MIPVLINAGARGLRQALTAGSCRGSLSAIEALFGYGAAKITAGDYECTLNNAAENGHLLLIEHPVETRWPFSEWTSGNPKIAQELQSRKLRFLKIISAVAVRNDIRLF